MHLLQTLVSKIVCLGPKLGEIRQFGSTEDFNLSTYILIFLFQIPEGIEMEMVTVEKGSSARIPLSTRYTSVIVVAGAGLLQGIQVINTKDTALVEKVDGVSEPEVIKKHYSSL